MAAVRYQLPRTSCRDDLNVEDVAAELALLDERGDLRLRFTDTPWRLGSESKLRGLALVRVFEQIL